MYTLLRKIKLSLSKIIKNTFLIYLYRKKSRAIII